MAVGNWVVSAVLRLNSSGFTAQMSRAAAATKSMNAQLARQNGQMSANELRMMKFQARMSEVRAAQLRFVTGAAAIGAGAGLFGITSAISDAAKLQQILLSIKNETGATGTQIGQFYNTAFAIANKNGMTPVQGAEILRTISRLTAGQFAVEKMMAIAPSVASFASNIHYNRPEIGVDEAAGVGLQTAHLFRAYQPRALNPLLDSVYRLSGLMAEKPEQALRQMSYYVPMFKMLGVANDTSIALMALLDRAGFRNKVGTNVRAQVLESLGPLQTTSHAQQGHLNLLERMGIFRNGRFAWNNANGSINFFGELSQLGKFVSGQIKEGVTRAKIAQEMFGAFGKQGGTIAALSGDPQMTSILAGIQKYLRDPNVGLQAASRNREVGLGFQFTRMIGNFTAVMTELGYPWLQDLTKFFKGIGDNLHNFQAWLHAHRDAEKTIGMAVTGTTAILALFAGAGALSMATNMLGIGRAFSLLSGVFGTGGGWLFSIRMLAPWILSLSSVSGWIAVAVAAIMTLNHLPDIAGRITQWWGRNQNNISYTIGYVFGSIGRWLVAAFKALYGMAISALGAVFGSLNSPSEFMKLAMGNYVGVGQDIANAVARAAANYKYVGGDASGQFVRGIVGGSAGHSYQAASALRGRYGPDAGKGVNMHIEKLEFHFGSNVSAKDAGAHAGETLLSLSAGAKATINQSRKTHGAYMTFPDQANVFDNMLFNK